MSENEAQLGVVNASLRDGLAGDGARSNSSFSTQQRFERHHPRWSAPARKCVFRHLDYAASTENGEGLLSSFFELLADASYQRLLSSTGYSEWFLLTIHWLILEHLHVVRAQQLDQISVTCNPGQLSIHKSKKT